MHFTDIVGCFSIVAILVLLLVYDATVSTLSPLPTAVIVVSIFSPATHV